MTNTQIQLPRTARLILMVTGLGLSTLLVIRISQHSQKSAQLAAHATAKSHANTQAITQIPTVNEPENPQQQHAIATAPQGNEIPFSGELRPIQEADLAFKIPGRIAKINVQAGQMVKEGQVLLILEGGEVAAQYQQAQAGIQAAQAQQALAEDAAKRTSVLSEKGAVSDQQKQQTQSQFKLAQAQLSQVEAQIRLLQMQMGNHALKAPFNGQVTKVPAGIGTMVAPGVPITGVVDTSRWKIIATASPEYASLLKPGARVQFSLLGLKEGRVSYISPVLQPHSRRVQFEITAEADGSRTLFGGQFLDGTVSAVTQEGARSKKK